MKSEEFATARDDRQSFRPTFVLINFQRCKGTHKIDAKQAFFEFVFEKFEMLKSKIYPYLARRRRGYFNLMDLIILRRRLQYSR